MTPRRKVDFHPLSYRGQQVTLRMAPSDPEVLARAIERMAGAGLNLLVIETEKGLRYDSHPEVSAAWAMPKETLRALLRRARGAGIACVPLLPSLSHAGWLADAHPETREAPGVICPRRESGRKLVFDLAAELLELFEPDFFHIGHDELLTSFRREERSSVLQCETCRGGVAANWFLEDVRRWHDFLGARGPRTMMWADMFAVPEEFPHAACRRGSVYGGPPDHFEKALDGLPRDIILCDWHYDACREYPTLRRLQDRGFEVLGCPLHRDNSFLFTRYALRSRTPRLLGMLGTSWFPLTPETEPRLLRMVEDNGNFFGGGDAPALRAKVAAAEARRFGAGDFEHVLDFSRAGQGQLETGGWDVFQAAADDRRGLDLKPGRTGVLWLPLAVDPGCVFTRLETGVDFAPVGPGRAAVSTDGGKRWISRPLAARIDWGTTVSGRDQVTLRLELTNAGAERVPCLHRFAARGRLVTRGTGGKNY